MMFCETSSKIIDNNVFIHCLFITSLLKSYNLQYIALNLLEKFINTLKSKFLQSPLLVNLMTKRINLNNSNYKIDPFH